MSTTNLAVLRSLSIKNRTYFYDKSEYGRINGVKRNKVKLFNNLFFKLFDSAGKPVNGSIRDLPSQSYRCDNKITRRLPRDFHVFFFFLSCIVLNVCTCTRCIRPYNILAFAFIVPISRKRFSIRLSANYAEPTAHRHGRSGHGGGG